MSGKSISLDLKSKGWKSASGVSETLGFLDLLAVCSGWMVRLTENPSAGLVLMTLTQMSAELEEPSYLWVEFPDETQERVFCEAVDNLRERDDVSPAVILEILRAEGFSVHTEYPN
ncbi:hypothetical protein ACFWRG_33810 [Micromonospora tulbaghiae]|uniref:Uncharacterized protein n=1 Tax=Streptomyces bacillaris TaxID=68179 RepID=A0ABW6DYW8_9ACTN|nr:hypothetical protein [Streptomyces nanshensis]